MVTDGITNNITLTFPTDEIYCLSRSSFLFVIFSKNTIIKRVYESNYSSYTEFDLTELINHPVDFYWTDSPVESFIPGGVALSGGIFFFNDARFIPCDEVLSCCANITAAIVRNRVCEEEVTYLYTEYDALPFVTDKIIPSRVALLFATEGLSKFTFMSAKKYANMILTDNGTTNSIGEIPPSMDYICCELSFPFEYSSRLYSFDNLSFKTFIPKSKEDVLMMLPKYQSPLFFNDHTIFFSSRMTKSWPTLFLLDVNEIHVFPNINSQDTIIKIDPCQCFSASYRFAIVGTNNINQQVLVSDRNTEITDIVSESDNYDSENTHHIIKKHNRSFLLNNIEYHTADEIINFTFSGDYLFVTLYDYTTNVYYISNGTPELIKNIDSELSFNRWDPHVAYDVTTRELVLFDSDFNRISSFTSPSPVASSTFSGPRSFFYRKEVYHCDFENGILQSVPHSSFREFYSDVFYQTNIRNEKMIIKKFNATSFDDVEIEEFDILKFIHTANIIHFPDVWDGK
ncbi:hypothetical protein PCE1_001512 [Barthelona sp. PCE]